MSSIIFEKQELSVLKSSIILLNYLFAILGGYKRLAVFIENRIGNSPKEISVTMTIRFTLYLIIVTTTIIIAYPLIKKSIKEFSRNHLGGLVSILFITSLGLLFIVVIMKVSGLNLRNQIDTAISMKENMYYRIFVALIYAPIVEEIVFRGVLYPAISNRYGYLCAIFITSFLFAFLHISDSLNNCGIEAFFYFSIYFVMSIGFCASYEYTSSVLGAIINHFIWNLLTVVAMVLNVLT
jgi:membrane protease YdiL (CAAX protease family)